jgi:sugar phosphate isomerase/epimerase
LAALFLVPVAAQNPFFAFDNGTGRDQKLPLADQAALVQRTGYAGLGYSGALRIPEVLAALDAHGLQLFSIYVGITVENGQATVDPALPQAIKQLTGRGTAIWLYVRGVPRQDDAVAARAVRQVAELAAQSGLRVVLYPHVGFCVERVDDALRIRQLAGRPNIGVSLNLAHLLALGEEPQLDQILARALPHLDLVSINGADHTGRWREGDWSQLIQTLDRGEFDVPAFVRHLRRLGYRGPVGLQAYRVAGDLEENLRRSMGAWRAMNPSR